MKILVTFAVESEFAAWRRQHDFRQVAHEPFALYLSEIAGNTVRALLTGMGTASATEATRWALASPADICISSGFAGASEGSVSQRSVLPLIATASSSFCLTSKIDFSFFCAGKNDASKELRALSPSADITLHRVAGAFEIPIVVREIAASLSSK